jgi:type IV secretion system protein VirD4
MSRQYQVFFACVALTFALFLIADQASAQSYFGNSGRVRQQALALTMIKVALVAIVVGIGFGLGWIMSPQGRAFRRIGLLILAGLVGLVAILNSGYLGWIAAFTFAVCGFFVGIFFWLRSSISSMMDMPDTFGSSRWATEQDIEEAGFFENEGLYIGECLKDGELTPIEYNGDRHLMTVAPTRSGKGTSQIIPNLLSYRGSVVVIDPKGENAMITAKARKDAGFEVHIVDPWGIVEAEGIETSTINPLDWLDPMDNEITENSMILADALVMAENHNDSFWNEEAKALLQGLLLHVASDAAEDGYRHLGRVREILVSGKDELTKVFTKMAESDHHMIASTGNRCLQKEDKLLSNVLASAQAQTHFLDSEYLRENMKTSSFKFEDLKTKPMTIYLVLPADRLNTFSRWLRLLVQQAITVNARNIQTKPVKPVLFILDEVAALGRLSMVEQAYGLMAGFGMQLWAIVQDVSQLERIYDKGWQSFVANAGMVNYFGSSDQRTAEYFSALCGEQTVWNFSSAVSHAFSNSVGQQGGGSSNTSTNSSNAALSQRKLAFPDELMRMNNRTQIILMENVHPILASKQFWFENERLKELGVNLHDQETVTEPAPAAEILNEE